MAADFETRNDDNCGPSASRAHRGEARLLIALGLLLAASAAHAATYNGDQTFAPPFSSDEPVIVNGNVTFTKPNSYGAASWTISGTVTFAERGLYTFYASQAGIQVGGRVLGPATGSASVHCTYQTVADFAGVVASNVGKRQPYTHWFPSSHS